MDKRYQVFISSTFVDLIDERQAVLKAILELDHMPAGMELFPATDDSAWQLIRDVIDASDYYVLIIGGRYGSTDAAGVGYTEKEYDYACETRKPVIPLLHQKPDELPRGKTETDATAWSQLLAFRKKVESRHTCVYWRNGDDLKSKVILGLTSCIKRHPATGWIRADKVPTDATVSELLRLKNRIADLEEQASALQDKAPEGTESLAKGDDCYGFEVAFEFFKEDDLGDDVEEQRSVAIRPTWNSIFAAVAPKMITEATDSVVRRGLSKFFETEARNAFDAPDGYEDYEMRSFEFPSEVLETCLIQMRALGLIRESDRKRSLKDTGTYWTLTPYGNHLMVQLRAIRRT